ncbi:Diadenosine 5',5'''-P1,P4-tetraphosphate phosphorylase 2 [Elsinoe australis]|uniref:Diadenosine 5',5'''-P1,P4-tetraphosphate phosphorylase 2 n=1 Tax=Elsinoe australis TaxID=40998 RepID=A0A2P7Z391_9PEZI|nr:Diadenosine 5',5'''-P1,P4-tetraphosphate phosphorylase 2 [Elsinoe australis]
MRLSQPPKVAKWDSAASLYLPPDLEVTTLARFDDLVSRGEILWESSEVQVHDDHGFQFEFRQTTSFNKKPSTAANDPGRTKAGSPFMNPRPSITLLPHLGPHHRLLFNEFCVWRPMLLLTTTSYETQTSPLNIHDLRASLALLRTFHPPYMMIYNCGINGGSSQGHKHMQLHPQPQKTRLFMAAVTSSETIADRIEGVPYQHFVLRIPEGAEAEDVLRLHDRLLERTREALEKVGLGDGYNVVMTREFIGLIPRRTAKTANASDVFGINAAGMMGLVTVRNERERERWAELGYGKYLARLGLPIDDGV